MALPEVFDGYLRLLRRADQQQPAQADHDPAAVVFGLGYGPVHESLPFAAAVLAAVRTSGSGPALDAGPVPVPVMATGGATRPTSPNESGIWESCTTRGW